MDFSDGSRHATDHALPDAIVGGVLCTGHIRCAHRRRRGRRLSEHLIQEPFNRGALVRRQQRQLVQFVVQAARLLRRIDAGVNRGQERRPQRRHRAVRRLIFVERWISDDGFGAHQACSHSQIGHGGGRIGMAAKTQAYRR